MSTRFIASPPKGVFQRPAERPSGLLNEVTAVNVSQIFPSRGPLAKICGLKIALQPASLNPEVRRTKTASESQTA
jgi:hypothetical protein